MRRKRFTQGGWLVVGGVIGWGLLGLWSATSAHGAEKAGGVVALRGQVTVLHEGAAAREALRFKEDVFWKDEINTLRQSGAKLLILRKSLLTIREESRVVLVEVDFRDPARGRSVLEMATGKVRALIQKGAFGPEGTFEIRTPNAVAAVRGTDVIVNVVSDRLTQMIVVSGSAIVRNLLKIAEVQVNPMQITEVIEDQDPTSPVQITAEFLRDFIRDLEIGEVAVKGDQPPASVKAEVIQQAAAVPLPPPLAPVVPPSLGGGPPGGGGPPTGDNQPTQLVNQFSGDISSTTGGEAAAPPPPPPPPPTIETGPLVPGRPPGVPPLP